MLRLVGFKALIETPARDLSVLALLAYKFVIGWGKIHASVDNKALMFAKKHKHKNDLMRPSDLTKAAWQLSKISNREKVEVSLQLFDIFEKHGFYFLMRKFRN